MGEDDGLEELISEEMLWDRIPEVEGEERASTYYELSARIYARGQYDEALALAETARDIYSQLGEEAPSEGLAQAYSAIGYNLNQLKRMDEAATAMSKAVELLRENKSPIALELACTLGEWWYTSKKYDKVVETMNECAQEHLVDGNEIGAANDLHLIGCAERELKNYEKAIEAFKEARVLFKRNKEVIHVARCDQKMASCLIELGEGELALETARDIYSQLGEEAPSEGLAQAYSAIGYNLNQLKRMDEAALAMSKAVELLRENKSPIALELACTLGEWWYTSKQYDKVVETMNECAQEHLVDGNEIGAANDLHLIGCAERELKNYEKAIEAFKEARSLFKRNKEVIHVARCDQKMASCLIELGQGEIALETARKAIDVFETGHDHRRETFASFEFGKAQILLEKYDEGLATLENVLAIVSEDEPKDFEFIVDVESRIAKILRMQGRGEEADEIERRLKTVQEALEDEPELDLLT